MTENKLREKNEMLSFRDLVVLSIAFMTPTIPAFLYYFPGIVVNGLGASSALIAFGAIFLTVLSFCKLYKTFPSSGSVFTFANNGIHPYAGFLAGWTALLFYILAPTCAIVMSVQIIKSAYPSFPAFILVIFITLISSAANYLGPKTTAKVATIIFLVVAAFVCIFILVCFISAGKGTGLGKILSFQPFFEKGFGFTHFLSASALLCLAFLGFDSPSLYTADAVNPSENMSKVFKVSCIIIGVFIFLQVYTAELVTGVGRPTFLSMEAIAGVAGGSAMQTIYAFAMIIAGVLVGIVGQSAAIRMITFMGRHDAIPHKIFARKQLVPNLPPLNMIIVFILVLIASLLPISVVYLEQLMIFAGALIFVIANVTVIVFFFFKKNDRDILTSVVFPAFGFFFTFHMWISVTPKSFIAGMIWLVLGALIILVKKKLKMKVIDARTQEEIEADERNSEDIGDEDDNSYFNSRNHSTDSEDDDDSYFTSRNHSAYSNSDDDSYFESDEYNDDENDGWYKK